MARECLEIKTYPHEVLRVKCNPVEDVTSDEIKLFEKMVITMHSFKGIGLAAPQVGIPAQLITFDAGGKIIKLANPEVLDVKGKERMAEGCLSVPNVSVEVERPFEVVVSGLNETGKRVEFRLKGFSARVLLHEVDHLKGKLIMDYMSFLEKIKYKCTMRR